MLDGAEAGQILTSLGPFSWANVGEPRGSRLSLPPPRPHQVSPRHPGMQVDRERAQHPRGAVRVTRLQLGWAEARFLLRAVESQSVLLGGILDRLKENHSTDVSSTPAPGCFPTAWGWILVSPRRDLSPPSGGDGRRTHRTRYQFG